MFSFLKSIFSKHNELTDNASVTSSKHRFEMVKVAVAVLNEFSRELRQCTPPERPDNIASIRGWTIRFEALGDYCDDLPSEDLKFLANHLDQPLKLLSSYVQRWEKHVSKIDPLLKTYEIMPGDEDTVDSVRLLHDRVLYAQQLAVSCLNAREKSGDKDITIHRQD